MNELFLLTTSKIKKGSDKITYLICDEFSSHNRRIDRDFLYNKSYLAFFDTQTVYKNLLLFKAFIKIIL